MMTDQANADHGATPAALRFNDQLGPLRDALDGLAFAAFQAGAAGEPLLTDCEDVAEWIAHTMEQADAMLAAERERCCRVVAVQRDDDRYEVALRTIRAIRAGDDFFGLGDGPGLDSCDGLLRA
jgi:hypothetical protein